MRRGTLAHLLGQIRCALGWHSGFDVRDRTTGRPFPRAAEICLRCPAVRYQEREVARGIILEGRWR